MRIRPRTPRRTSSALLAALVLIAGGTASSCTNSASATTLTVLTPWTNSDESYAFQQVVNAFTSANPGIQVNVQATRSLAAALQSDVQQDTTPDLAVMPNPSALRTYAQQGALQPLDGLVDKDVSSTLPAMLKSDYGGQWYDLMRAWSTHPYAVPVKVDIKSLIWYDPRRLPVPSAMTWNDLMALSASTAQTTTPWCLALADPPSSGWPGTDWIEDILLHQSGAADYIRWAQGKLAWASPQVTAAWQTWGDIVAKQGQVYGAADAALLTSYGAGDDPMFETPPGCYLSHGALVAFDATTTPKPAAGVDYDFVDFPSFGQSRQPVYEVAGDMMGIFHDSPAADRFLAFVAGSAAQTKWPTQQPASAFSANRQATTQLGATVYAKNKVAKGVDDRLTNPAATLCFDASDLMPDAMTNAFYRAVLEYVQDPGKLSEILRNLDAVRSGAYSSNSPSWPLPVACGMNTTP